MNSQAIHTISYDRILYSLQPKKKNMAKGSKVRCRRLLCLQNNTTEVLYTNSKASSELSRTEIMKLSWL